MSGDDTANLIYLVLLGAAICGWYMVGRRENMGKTLQQILIWVFLFVGVMAGFGLWQDIQRDANRNNMTQIGQGQIAVPRQADGHYYLTLNVNNQPIRFVVDTGATQMVLSKADAMRAGLDPDDLNYFGQANTANGVVRTAPVRLNTVELGDITDTDVPAVVNDGAMDGSLLGMTYLQKWGRIEITQGELILTR